MRCSVCGKSKEEAVLFEGISEGKVIDICDDCAQLNQVPLIKKPTSDQLMTADQKYSVRERMEMISDKTGRTMSTDQSVAKKNIEKIHFPIVKKQEPESLIKNYFWVLKVERRKRKLTLDAVSKETGIASDILKSIEEGQLPKNFEETIRLLEGFFSIRLLTEHEKHPRFVLRKTQERVEKDILEETKSNMEFREVSKEKQMEEEVKERDRPFSTIIEPKKERVEIKVEEREEKTNKMKDIGKGKFDFSKRQNLDNITLSDLSELKKEKEKKDMIGSDLELDE
jgi:ribosome-binding protein aMBF1 (putative translation factor)